MFPNNMSTCSGFGYNIKKNVVCGMLLECMNRNETVEGNSKTTIFADIQYQIMCISKQKKWSNLSLAMVCQC